MIEKPVKLSVLLCVYNGKPHLEQAIKSILAQSYTDFELILVDDGSTDKAVTEIEQLGDQRIKIVRKSNTGLTDSLNVGLEHCSGKYVARHDADDVSLPERFEKQIDFLQQNKHIGAVGSAVKLMDEDGDIIGELNFPTGSDELHRLNISTNQFVHGSLMFRRELLKKVNGYRTEFIYAQDYDLTLRCQEKTPLANLQHPLYLLRFGSQRISANKTADQAAIAGMAREFARQRREKGKDAIQTKQYDGNYMKFSDSSIEHADSQQVLLYLYLRSGYAKKARACIRSLFVTGNVNRLKLALNYILSFLPKKLTMAFYNQIDSVRSKV